MKLAIVGSRDLKNYEFFCATIFKHFLKWTEDRELDMVFDEILTGDCPTGADAMALKFADANRLRCKIFRADWSVGPKGGPLRNQEIINAGPDLVLAFMAKDSKGTKDCVRRALKGNIPVLIIPVEKL